MGALRQNIHPAGERRRAHESVDVPLGPRPAWAWAQRVAERRRTAGRLHGLSRWLMEQRAAPSLIASVLRAAHDAVAHAELCRRVALVANGQSPHLARAERTAELTLPPPSSVEPIMVAIVDLCVAAPLEARLYEHARKRSRVRVAARALERMMHDAKAHAAVGHAVLEWRLSLADGAAQRAGLELMSRRALNEVRERLSATPALFPAGAPADDVAREATDASRDYGLLDASEVMALLDAKGVTAQSLVDALA